MRKRNWLHETKKETHERRIAALEAHIQDLEERYATLENYVNKRFAEVLNEQDEEPWTG